jgi:hypothetical protein
MPFAAELYGGLSGRGFTSGTINKDGQETQKVLEDNAKGIKPEMEARKTPESWAKEGAALARKVVYLDGELLKPRPGSTDDVI